jgi:hypothetical protein
MFSGPALLGGEHISGPALLGGEHKKEKENIMDVFWAAALGGENKKEKGQ